MVDTLIEAPPPRRSPGVRALVRWGRLCSGGALLVFLLAEIAGGVWPVVLLTPMTPQWAAVGLIGAALLLLAARGRPGRGDLGLVAAGCTAAAWGAVVTLGFIPWHALVPAEHARPGEPDFGRVKVMAANVHTENTDHRTILAVIAAEDPDVIILPEIDDAWARDLTVLNARYPLHTKMPESLGNFGMAFFSKLPGDATWTIMKPPDRFSEYDVPQLDATLRLTDAAGKTHTIRFVGLHPLPPLRPGNTRARDAVLRTVGQTIARQPQVPTIVAGDLNATRYCRTMQTMTHPSGLRDAAAPLRFSWPNTWSWWAMGIRIDHVLATDAWHVIDAHHGHDIGSDHLPIIATLQLVRAGE